MEQVSETEYWNRAFAAYKAATGYDAPNAWEVMCFFANQKSAVSLSTSILGFDLF